MSAGSQDRDQLSGMVGQSAIAPRVRDAGRGKSWRALVELGRQLSYISGILES